MATFFVPFTTQLANCAFTKEINRPTSEGNEIISQICRPPSVHILAHMLDHYGKYKITVHTYNGEF